MNGVVHTDNNETESRRKKTLGFSTQFDTNRPVHL